MTATLKNKKIIYKPVAKKRVKIPLFLTRVSAGTFSPADDYIEKRLDLNEHLIQHPTATFLFNVSGESMTGVGIFSGDIVLVDRAIKPVNGSIVIAKLDGELVCKTLRLVKGKMFLQPENPKYKTIEITQDMEGFEICGVVLHNIHTHLRGTI